MDQDSHNAAMPPSSRRPGMFSSALLIALLALEGWLFACDHFGWCGFGTRKGWAVLIATGSASLLLTLFIAWFLICMLAGRRRQFSLGWLLLLTLAVANPLGWLTSSVQRANRQHEAIAKLESDYASVQFARDSKWSKLSKYSPPPAFLESLFKREFFDDVVALSMGDGAVVHPVSDTELAYLYDFDQLRSLEIHFNDGLNIVEDVEGQVTSAIGPRISNAGLSNLQELDLLEELTLASCDQLTDTDLANIAVLDRLTTLSLRYLPRITDAGLGHLRKLNRLKRLRLEDLPRVTNSGLAGVGSLSSLRILWVETLNSVPLTDKAVEDIAALTGLQSLILDGTNLTDVAMQHIGQFKHLRTLSLCESNLTDAGVKQIGELKDLESLALTGTAITDASVKVIKRLPRLHLVNLFGTKITNAGSAELQQLGWIVDKWDGPLVFSRELSTDED